MCKYSVPHQRKGFSHYPAETFIKHVVLSCVFTIVKQKAEVNDRELQKMLGALTHQISSARAAVQDLIDNNSMVRSRERKIRRDKIIIKLERHVFDFLLDDKFTRLDTKQGLEDVIDPRSETREQTTVHKIIWLNSNKE